MGRYILRYTGGTTPPAADLAAIAGRDGMTVVERTPKMLLVEATEPTVQELVGELAGWVATPERFIPPPDTRKKPRPPED